MKIGADDAGWKKLGARTGMWLELHLTTLLLRCLSFVYNYNREIETAMVCSSPAVYMDYT